MPKKNLAASQEKSHQTIDAYFETVPVDSRATLLDLRKTIRSAAPEAKEAFVYGVPGFKLDGKPFVCYASFKNHCGFYPMSPEVLSKFASELKGFETSKGTIRFLPAHPLPKSLVIKIVKARVSEIKKLNH